MQFRSVNPATGETLASFPSHTPEQIDEALTRAVDAQLRWRFTAIAERAQVVRRLGELLNEDKERLARMMTLEMGKTLKSAVDEAAKCATACEFYATRGPSFAADEIVAAPDPSFVAYDPLGVVLAVMPWNFPFWQVIRFLAPALVAGNGCILKHASNVPQCALEIELLARRAGAPDGLVQALLVSSDDVAAIIADDRIAAVTLTGSEGAGRSVAASAGQALKRCVLELGGSDPFIVMPSADIALAVNTAVKARIINNGQSCIAAKRFIVHGDIADAFTARFVEAMSKLVVGDPFDPATDVGPLASVRQASELHEQVKKSANTGAQILCGGVRLSSDTAFYPPTVLSHIPEDAPAWSEELFGPVASVFVANDVTDAIRIANSTRFGLACSIWTNDSAERERFIRELDAGTIAVNAMVASDPRFPFGGVKASGYGRELSAVGMHEFMNIKTVRLDGSASGSGAE